MTNHCNQTTFTFVIGNLKGMAGSSLNSKPCVSDRTRKRVVMFAYRECIEKKRTMLMDFVKKDRSWI